MKIKIIINCLLVLGLLTPTFGLAQVNQVPQNMDEAQGLGLNILNRLPEAIKNVWQNQALPIWLSMWDWTKNIWQSSLGAKAGNLWDRILDWVGLEKPDIQQEFQKERQETQQDLWDRFLDLLK